PVPIAPPEPGTYCDVSLAISVAYLYPNLAVGATRPGGHLLEHLGDSVKFESHPIKSCLTNAGPGRVGQAGARGFSAHGLARFSHFPTLLVFARSRPVLMGHPTCDRESGRTIVRPLYSPANVEHRVPALARTLPALPALRFLEGGECAVVSLPYPALPHSQSRTTL